MNYYVEVTRLSYARQTVKIDAPSVEEAKTMAVQRAAEDEFTTYDNEYEVSSIQPAALG